MAADFPLRVLHAEVSSLRTRLPAHGPEELLTFEELRRVAEAFVAFGIEKLA